ncbi:MAG TPA: flavodoxin [Candidatus Merdisoma merdipullorum]|nr:flavodoxin [Candidatus Merdisoma merdipullorum]
MKKKLIMALAGAAIIGLIAGCGSSRNTSEDTDTTAAAEDTQETADTTETTENTQETADTTETTEDSSTEAEIPASAGETDSEGGKILVVYYSATGNTENVANMIAEITGADVFELEPAEPYTDADLDWTDDSSRVVSEYENEELRDIELVADTVDNWDSYDTVFVGYPIWWGIAAWPMDGFVEANDFTGKTVIPFCTSSSSGLGESGQLLADMAGTGDWQEGMRFRSSASQEDVQEWIDGLGL